MTKMTVGFSMLSAADAAAVGAVPADESCLSSLSPASMTPQLWLQRNVTMSLHDPDDSK